MKGRGIMLATANEPNDETSRSWLRGPADRGFTLVEVLIVIVIIGILATVVVFAVRTTTDQGEAAACGADARVLSTAAEVYLAENQVDVIPATGAGGDRFEQTLVDDGLLAEVSGYYDVDTNGVVSTNGEPCT
jgi:prepilin-type N-terminal cleavage/methylation domain-containing protein